METDVTRKMKDGIKKLENIVLKALNSLSKDPLRNHSNDLSAEITPDGENTILVQPTSHGLGLVQENSNPNEFFVGAQPNLHDKGVS